MITERQSPTGRPFTLTFLGCMVMVNLVISWSLNTRFSAFALFLEDNLVWNWLPDWTQVLLLARHWHLPQVLLAVASAVLWAVARVPVTNSVLRIACFMLTFATGVATMVLLYACLSGPMDAVQAVSLGACAVGR